MNFVPNVWADVVVAQMKSSLVFAGTREPFIGPLRKPVLYHPVDDWSGLHYALQDELDAHVPYGEVDEAAQVMIHALNQWIEKKVTA